VTIAILAGFSSVILVMLMGQSRVFYSMSHDGLVPKIFSDVHPRYKTPWKSNMVFFVFTGLFAAFIPGDIVGEMTSIGTLFAFILVCIGVWIIRRRRPDLPRGFKVPAQFVADLRKATFTSLAKLARVSISDCCTRQSSFERNMPSASRSFESVKRLLGFGACSTKARRRHPPSEGLNARF